MKRNILPVVLMGLMVLGLLTGCRRQASPDVTATPPLIAHGFPEETPGLDATAIAATAIANATLAAQAVEVLPPTATPTPPPTATPTPLPTATPVLPTATPTVVPVPPAAPAGAIVHVVQPGENLFRIALRYGTTVAAIANANNIANPAQIRVGQVLRIPTGTRLTMPAGETTYVVRPGDNLFRIALRYGTTVAAIANANNIANPAQIRVGQVLRIPAGTQLTPLAGETIYVVQPGDNLFRIALRYGLSHTYLARYNGIANPLLIYVGQVLRIPPR